MKVKFNNRLSKLIILGAIIFIVGSIYFFSVFILNEKDKQLSNNNIEEPKSFTMDQLGVKAQDKMNPNSFVVQETKEGIIIEAQLQKLKGILTSNGINIQSTSENKKDFFSIQSKQLYRADTKITNDNNLDYQGEASTRDNSLAILKKNNFQEEYSSSADGLKQDFLIQEKIEGNGNLFLSLDVKGATTKLLENGVSLVLDKSQRELIYQQLSVFDSNNKKLPAKFVVARNNQIEIEVDDLNAIYPIRIDPTIADDDWLSMGVYTGLNSLVYSLAFDSLGNLYAGGSSSTTGGVVANYIAKWDGSNWSALGSGMNDRVYSVAVDSSNNLYAGGLFTSAGGVSAKYIAKWDGSSWSALGAGMGGNVFVITIDNFDNLYVGGEFLYVDNSANARCIAKWDGSTWSALGSGINNTVWALAFDSLGNLYAGGQFTSAGDNTNAKYIAKWDGSNWSALGIGMSSTVKALTFDSYSNLYAGGQFTTAGGISARYIAKWDGSNWSALGTGVGGYVDAITVDNSDNLYVGGSFSSAGDNTNIKYIAKWDGSNWSALGTGTDSSVSSFATDSSGNIYAGGNFIKAGDTLVNYVAKWDDSSWSALGTFGIGLQNTVEDIAIDSSGNLYVAGWFKTAGGINVNNLAKWNGTAWSALGTGLTNPSYYVKYVAVDSLGNLYAGGFFTEIGGVLANYIAKWNGTAWSALGTGLDNQVYDLAVDSLNNLYVAGAFTKAGGVTVNRIAKWDGTAWSALGTNPGVNGGIYDIAINSSNNLYVGGQFTTAGGVAAQNIAKWNGSSWSALGAGVSTLVYSLAVDSSNNVYTGGSTTGYIAKWNGVTWSNIGISTAGVYALAVDAFNNLYVGGRMITQIDGMPLGVVAKWNGSNWSSLGTGVGTDINYSAGIYSEVKALAFDSFGTLYVGGNFTKAGGKDSFYLAKWNGSHPYYINYTAGPSGTISGVASQKVIKNGGGTQVIAVPNTNYHFTSWSDGVLTATRTDTNVTADISVTANFAINSYSVFYPPGPNGSIEDGSIFQIIDYGLDSQPFKAVPNTGYHFVYWSDGSTDNPRTFSNLQKNIFVIPIFALDVASPAGSPDLIANVTGYAWNEKIGWISLNCSNNDTCAVSQYGININTSGDFSGHAWNPIVGWIDFGPTSGYPSEPNTPAHYDKSSGQITGWIKAISLGDDGWIKMSGSWAEGVSMDSEGNFFGFAWNGNNEFSGYSGLGWISFNCLNTDSCATSNFLTNYENVGIDPPANLTTETLSCNEVKLSWNYYSTEITGFQGQYCDTDCTEETNWHESGECQPGPAIYYCTESMSANDARNFRVKARSDSGDSDWSNQATGITSYCPPENLAIGSSNCAGVKLTWASGGIGVDHYEILRSVDGGEFQLLQDNIPPSQFEYTDINFEEDTEYSYKVIAQTDGSESDIVEVTPCPSLQWWREVK